LQRVAEAIRVSIDGELSDPHEATISVLDDGLLRGDGAFEAIKLYGAHPFRLAEHIDRLERSAEAIHLDFDRPALEAEVDALLADLARSGAPAEAMLRIVLTRGGRRIALAEQLPDWPETVDVALVQLSPSEILAGVKSISYAANMHATRIASGRGADEAIYVDRDGIVLEAPTSSVFWAGDNGVLRTPELETGILDSITRRVVVEALAAEEGRYEADELRGAREAFLASTTREIQPLASIDGVPLPEPTGGAHTIAAADALRTAVELERNAAAGRSA
jgi:branched-chain amino acid aminotransferase